MELSITRTKAALLVAGAAAFGWYHVNGGRAPDLPPELREVLPAAPSTPAPTPTPPAREAPDDDAPTSPAGSAEAATPSPSGEGAPKKPERTPDEKARSKIGVAESYAENGRYDRAFEVLDEADALEPTAAVKAEVEAARERVTALMRSRR